MGSFSIWHWLIVLLVIILIFGTKKLRNIGSDLGGAVKSFKDGMRENESKQQDTQAIEGEVTVKSSATETPAKDKTNTHV